MLGVSLDGLPPARSRRLRVGLVSFWHAFIVVAAAFIFGFGMGRTSVTPPTKVMSPPPTKVAAPGGEPLLVPLAGYGVDLAVANDASVRAFLRDDEWTKMRGLLREECGR